MTSRILIAASPTMKKTAINTEARVSEIISISTQPTIGQSVNIYNNHPTDPVLTNRKESIIILNTTIKMLTKVSTLL